MHDRNTKNKHAEQRKGWLGGHGGDGSEGSDGGGDGQSVFSSILFQGDVTDWPRQEIKQWPSLQKPLLAWRHSSWSTVPSSCDATSPPQGLYMSLASLAALY